MSKPRRTKAFQRLAAALRKPRPPFTPAQLAAVWVAKNFDPLAHIALRSLRDPIGTTYRVEPFVFAIFESDAFRTRYLARLLREARRVDPKFSRDERLCLHVAAVTDWARDEMAAAFAAMAVQARFQP